MKTTLLTRFLLSVTMIVILFTSNSLYAQTTLSTQVGSTGYTGGNGLSGNCGITFVIENTSGNPMNLTDVATYLQVGTNGASMSLWYSSTSLSGATPGVTTTDWTKITTTPSVSVPIEGVTTVFTGMSFLIPNGATYRFCIESASAIRYSGSGAGSCTPSVFTSGGVSLRVGESTIGGSNIGYSVTFPAGTLGNNPRWFTGTVTLQPALPCVAPPTAGNAITSAALVCPNSNFDLNLAGSSIGTGMSYQWQSSPDSTTWTNITLGTTQKFTTSLTTTTYYRCEVICSGVSSFSSGVKVGPRPILAAGTYTVNENLPSSATNFTSFASVLQAISCGVAGDVVFNVDSNTYVGKLEFSGIPNTSSSKTITFNGNKSKLTHTSSALDPTSYVVLLKDVSYITLNNFTIELNSASTKGSVVTLWNANYNTIKNCKIVGDMGGTLSTYSGIAFSGSATASTTATNAKFNTIEDNDISGGYYGIALVGTTATTNVNGNIIRRNNIRDFYLYGIYNAAADSTQIISNNIYRLNRTTLTTTYGVFLTTNSKFVMISKNRIRDFFVTNPTSTSTSVGIFFSSSDATAGKEVIVSNNIISNTGNNGINYGIQNTGSDGTFIYHNTIVLDHPNSTAGVGYGIYQTTAATRVNIRNNNISINKGGAGAKNALYFATTTSTITCNYNNLYVNTAASGAGVKNIGNWGTTGYATLALWKGANASAFDQNSLSEVPNFNTEYVPNNSTLDNSGVFIASVTEDIKGALRSLTTPDIGAYEFAPILNDASIISMVNPGASLCPGLTTVSIKVKNFGLSSLNSVNVNWSINNVVQPVFTTSSLSLPIGTDTTLAIGNYTFLSGVNYNIVVWTSNPNSGIDEAIANDTLKRLNVKTGFAGNITVGGVGANYPTITAAVNDMQILGICGPVTVNVNPSAGPYLEAVTINTLPGASSINRVTFKGNNAEIKYESSNTNIRSVLRINGADYITIDSFILNGYRGTLTTNFGWGISMSSGSHYNKIINNTINVSDSTSSSNYAGIVLSGSTTGSTTAGEFKYDTIENNIVNGGYYGITLCGTSGSSALSRGNVIKGNRVRNAYYYTMYLTYLDSLMIKNNDLSMQTRSVASTFHYVLDMIGVGAKSEISGNRIHDYFIAAPTTTGTCYVIYNSTVDNTVGNETIVYNNNIYNMGGNMAYYGIYNTGCDGFSYYHNTIVLDHQAATTAVTYGIYQTTAASNLIVKNNNISINRGGVGAEVGLYFATNTSLITSDYNDIYVPNGNVGFWTALVPNLAAWRLANSQSAFDLNSISVDPLMNSSKINIPQTGSPLINAGTQIPTIQTDLLGNPRSGTSPYIGAYELNGDYSGPVLSFVPILNSASTTGNVLTAFLTASDVAGVDTSLLNRPRVYFKRATDKNEYNGNTGATVGWKYAVATNNTSPFNFQLDYSKLFGGTVVVGDKIEYFVVARDVLGNVNVEGTALISDPTNINLNNKQFPAASPAFYKIGVAKSGTMLVGINETYKSLTGVGGAFEYLNNNLLGGNVNIVIKSNLTENGLNALNAFAESGGSGYKISITPFDDTLKTLTGAYVGGLIRINGADRVTIDGRHNGAGRFLKIDNNTATSGSAGVQIISLGNNAGSENITIRNITVLSGSAGNSIPIHIGGPALPYSPGASNNKIKIIDNIILRGSVGIYAGGSENYEGDSLLVEGNTIGSDVVGEQLRLYGLALEVQKNPIINNNIIKNIINISAQQAWGIASYDGFKNGKITNNKIEKVSSGSGAFGGRGIEIVSNDPNENILIANNFIGEITGPGSRFLNTSATIGIGLIATGGVTVYNNSINLSGNISASTTIPDTSAGIYLGAGSRLLNIRNNSIVNSLFNGADTSVAYALFSAVSDTAFIDINNNNYYNGTGNAQGKLARINGTDLVTLAQVQVATTKDLNSISDRPNYVSNIDLHAQGATLFQKGVSIPIITTDIDGNTRNPIPCIGADEYTPPANDVEVAGIIYPKALSCGKSIDSVGILIRNLGTASQTGFNIKVEITGVVNATLNKTFSKILSVNGRDTIYIGTFNSNVQGIASFRIYSELSNDAIRLNDTIHIVREFSTTPAMPTANNATICKGTSATLVASNGSLSYTWYDAAVGGNAVSSDDTLITPPLSNNQKYWVETAAGTTTGSVKITEIDIGGTDMIEIQNLSPGLVNTAGWKVIVSDSYTLINAVNTITWNLPAQMTGGQVLYKTDGSADNYWGNNLFWNPGAFPSFSGWAMILDNNDAIVDAVFMNWPSTNILGASIVYNAKTINIGTEWAGNGINITTVAATSSVSRAGNKDNNNSTDFTIATTTKNVTNAVLVLPYISNGCPSDRREVLVSMLPRPIGSTVAQSAPFQGIFNAGTDIQPDAACVGDTLTYNLTPPTGFTVPGLGTTWNVLNPMIKTNHGATVAGTVTMTGLSLQYIASTGDKDSTLVFTATIHDMSSGCDSNIIRYLNVGSNPTVNLGLDQTICEGAPLVLTADSSTSYLWSTGATTRSITVTTGGTYSVRVTNAGGCDATDMIVITANPKPVVNLGSNVSACAGTPVVLDAGNPGATYLWSNGATTQTITVNNTGTYFVGVTGANGCISKDTIVVTIKASPIVNLGTDLNICTSDTITLDAGNSGSSYLWSTGSTTRTIKVSLAGTYSVEVTNADGCKSSDQIVVTNKAIPNANFTAQGVNSLNYQFNATSQAGSTFEWNFGDPTSPANTSAIVNPIHEFTAAGTYFVTLRVTNVATGCVSINIDTLNVISIGINSSVVNTQNLVAIPNPFVGQTKVEYTLLNDAENVTIEVFDVVGRKVARLVNGESQIAGKHSLLYVNEDKQNSSGVYMIRLTVDGKSSMIRVVDIE